MDITSTYFHNMSISRLQDTIDEWGGTIQKYEPIPIMQLIPCAFSQSSRNSQNATQTDSVNVIKYNPKIFCDPNLDIIAGDRIEVRFNTRLLGSFTASEPYIYNSHQEIPLLKLGEA